MTVYIGRAIDESGVPPEKRQHPEYRRLYLKLHNELTALNAIEIFCTHEAGHLIFFRQAGFTRFEFFGPTMTYDSLRPYDDESRRYNYFLAAVRVPEILAMSRYDDTVLDALARGAAAGELFNEIRQQRPPVPNRQEYAPEDLIRLWLGHAGSTVTDRYVNIEKDKTWRKEQAEKIGVGFTLPTSVVPNVPRLRRATEAKIAA